MTDHPEAESIAAALTEAQHWAMRRDWRVAHYANSKGSAFAALGRKGLLRQTQDRIGNTMWRATPLGLEVLDVIMKRTILQERS